LGCIFTTLSPADDPPETLYNIFEESFEKAIPSANAPPEKATVV